MNPPCLSHERTWAVRPQPSDLNVRGFTLIETVAVLAIVAVLAAVVAENIMTRMRMAARTAEANSLATMSQTLQQFAVRSKVLPAATNVPATLAAEMAVALERVQRTAGGNPRWVWADPACLVGATPTTLPYVQTAAGSAQPSRVRMVLVSSVGAPLPARTNAPTATEFESMWTSAAGGVPACLQGTWQGAVDDLKIQRVDLGALFCRVVLENVDFLRTAPYSVETTNTLTTIASGSRRDFWLLRGTVLNFHYSDNSLQAREYLAEDVSYTFENGRWGRYLRYGPNRANGWFGEMVDRFLAAPPPPGGTRRYSTQQWIVDAMYGFLYNFGQWSLDYFYGGPPWPHIPGYEQSSAGATGLSDYSGDLLINN